MMNRLVEVLENILGCLFHPVESYKFLGSSLRAFILDGAVSIETALEYQPLDKIEKYWFRTMIQLDGDIINIVPRSNLDDSGWQEAFQSAYRTHQEKLKQFVSQLDGIRIIAWMTGTIISAIPTFMSWKFGPSEIWGYALGWEYLILLPILAYLVRKYALRTILWLIVRIAVRWSKRRLQIA